nr:histidine kinase [Methyloferula stellata]
MTPMSRPIDLKLRLALRVAGLAALCFIAASAYVLFDSDQSARMKAEGIAKIVAKDLELQQDQGQWVKNTIGRFPDLQVIAASFMAPGLCIAYRAKSGEILQRLCSGTQSGETGAPEYFSEVYRSIFKPGTEAASQVVFRNEAQGEAVVSVNPDSLIAQAWHETNRLFAVMAITLLALCILVYAALARALRPTRVIVAGLERLAGNEFSTRMPAFDLAELSAIRDVFNQLAETLEKTLAERNELTKRLIVVQDDERLNLARELHDEFGQCLAAISAVAASAGQTAKEECPALLPECQSIARTAAHMMETLRGALIRLRPPDVDELGLTSSLESLVAGWNSRSRGKTRFEIEVRGGFDALPSPFGASLYRIAQEAITNAAKHAEATRVGLHLYLRGADAENAGQGAQEIEMVIDDDGKATGIDLAGKSGMGLLGMRERIAALGGKLRFEARQPTGLILHAVIPAPGMARGGCPS